MSQKNILEFSLSPDLGGLELFMVSCIDSFSKTTNLFTAIATNKKLDNYLEKQEHKLQLKRSKLFPIIPALKLAKYIDDNAIDIIHFHWTRDIVTAVLAKRLSKKKPLLVQSRHMRMTRFKNDIYHKWLYKNIDIIHAVTHQVKEQLEEFIPLEVRPQIEVVHPGTSSTLIDSKELQNLRDKYNLQKSFVVGIVGRIEEAKGQFLVLEAIAKLKSLDIKALIVGSAMSEAYLKELKAMVKDLGIEDRVIFTGFTKEVNLHIHLCDVLVLATQEETFGLVVIEAMRNKVTILATNRGGPLEIIEDMQDGLLFERNSEALAQKISILYNDSTLKQKLALAGYHKALEKFDNNKQLTKLLKVITSYSKKSLTS